MFDKQRMFRKNVREESVKKMDIELHYEARTENMFLEFVKKIIRKSLCNIKIYNKSLNSQGRELASEKRDLQNVIK